MRCDGERMFLHTFRMFSYGIFSTDVFFLRVFYDNGQWSCQCWCERQRRVYAMSDGDDVYTMTQSNLHTSMGVRARAHTYACHSASDTSSRNDFAHLPATAATRR